MRWCFRYIYAAPVMGRTGSGTYWATSQEEALERGLRNIMKGERLRIWRAA